MESRSPLHALGPPFAAADRLSAAIRGLFSGASALSDTILSNGAVESGAVRVGVISYGGCTCLLSAAPLFHLRHVSSCFSFLPLLVSPPPLLRGTRLDQSA